MFSLRKIYSWKRRNNRIIATDGQLHDVYLGAAFAQPHSSIQFICLNISLYQKSCKGRKSNECSLRTSFLRLLFLSRFSCCCNCCCCCLNFFFSSLKANSTYNQDVFIIIFDYRLLCLMFFLFLVSPCKPHCVAVTVRSPFRPTAVVRPVSESS